jgi:hypothetical protein
MRYFPIIDESKQTTVTFATITTIIALILGVVAGLFLNGPPKELNPAFLRYYFTIFDPYALQIIATVHCCICLIFFINPSQPSSSRASLILNSLASLSLMALIFVCFYVINDVVFKPSFNRPRPDLVLGNNVGFVSRYFEASSSDGAPSGFASRSVLLFLTATLASFYIKPKKGILNIFTSTMSIGIIQFIFIVLCCWGRVGVGFHYWFDVFIGISFGTFIFWFFNIVYKWLLVPSSLEDFIPYSTILVCIIIGFVIIGFFYSRDATSWAPSIIAIVLLTLSIDLYKIIRKPTRKT